MNHIKVYCGSNVVPASWLARFFLLPESSPLKIFVKGVMSTTTNEVTDVLIKRGFKRAAIVGMATGSSTVFEGVLTMAIDESSTATAMVGSTLIFLGVMLTAVSAVGYRQYTKYRACQVDAVMTKARRMARGEGASPALLDLGTGGELLRVMAVSNDGVSPCDTLQSSEPYCNGRMHEIIMSEIMTNSGRTGSVDNLLSPKSMNVASIDRQITVNSRKSGSVDNLADLRTIKVSPGMIVMPVYLEESSSTVEVYMPDEYEAPQWLYSDMLKLFWLAVFFASIGQTLLNTAFIILAVAFKMLPNATIYILFLLFGGIGGLGLLAAGVLAYYCYKIYQRYLHENSPSPCEDRSLSNGPVVWQLL